ncbi:mechanosensitive ion channel [Marinilongibacter aquaticus]|uniref:mechanosensitive ion channel n=1 Tax=Marinilongibacter aquaticus TaxID=2975157 RepID=UPI0021BDE660|nr:mechanosensitive ion channel [Marinilongibacter aquaticus]UBM60381.1 mechanosensitive ion channel [Marinilongibacter aquaticus]
MDYFNSLIDSLSTQFGNGLPRVLGALLVLIIGLFIAGLVRRLVMRLFSKTDIDEKIAEKINSPYRLDKFVSKLFYYLVVVYTLIVVLSMMGVEGVLAPLESMLGKFVGYVPNFIGAGLIAFAGYMIAMIMSEATGFLSERIEGFGERIGLDAGKVSLSKIVKQVIFILVFLPVLIVALDTLQMTAVSGPATEMLSTLLAAVPQIIAAALLLAVFYIVGKYVVSILVELLKNLGLDTLAENIGLKNIIGTRSLSVIMGNIALFFIMFTAIIAAVAKLHLGMVEEILTEVFHVSGKIFFGLIVLMAGVVISNIAANAIAKTQDSGFLVPVVRFAVIGIFLAFSLSTMGIAENIVNLAFGLTLGAVAVAFALSFGLGGREAAGKQLERFFNKLNEKNK